MAAELFILQGGAEPHSSVPVWAEPGQLLIGIWRVGNPFALFLLTKAHSWMMPLYHVDAEEPVWLLRVPDPSSFEAVKKPPSWVSATLASQNISIRSSTRDLREPKMHFTSLGKQQLGFFHSFVFGRVGVLTSLSLHEHKADPPLRPQPPRLPLFGIIHQWQAMVGGVFQFTHQTGGWPTLLCVFQ
jgi:hypothetical protein